MLGMAASDLWRYTRQRFLVFYSVHFWVVAEFKFQSFFGGDRLNEQLTAAQIKRDGAVRELGQVTGLDSASSRR